MILALRASSRANSLYRDMLISADLRHEDTYAVDDVVFIIVPIATMNGTATRGRRIDYVGRQMRA